MHVSSRKAGALLAACLLAAIPTVAPSAARAQELTAQQARSLFQEARALIAGGDYATALVKLERVATFKRTPQVVYYVGVCHEKTGKLVMALGAYRIALADAQAAGTHEVVREAQASVARLEPRIPLLTLTKGQGAQAATIQVDGKEIGDAAMAEPMPLDPGTHVIEAHAQGFKPFRRETTLSEGDKPSIEVALVEKTDDAPPASGADTTDAPTEGDNSSADLGQTASEAGSSTLGWIVTGVGVAALATSGYFFAQRSSAMSDLDDQCGPDRDQCPASAKGTYDDGKKYTTLGNIALGVGAVGVVTGVIILVTSGGSSSEQEPSQLSRVASVRVLPCAQGSWAGLSLDGRF
ncbi:MAG: PEGA domain-containing protein [Polyangiaceae bacterium]|nr:PEGA domain-containing protein [Polyangiaceae bacterium]